MSSVSGVLICREGGMQKRDFTCKSAKCGTSASRAEIKIFLMRQRQAGNTAW